MDKHILEFTTQSEADNALAVINQIAENYWLSQGYTVINHQLVGKKNGVDNPDACKTITWDTVKESPDGTFYISSPSSSERFVDWRDYLPDGVVMPEDKAFPDAWIEEEIS